MGLFRKIAAFLGFPATDHDHPIDGTGSEDHQGGRHHLRAGGGEQGPRGRRSGFRRTVEVERPKLVPVIVPCEKGDGGIQGFNWYRERLKIDEDGDVADEFLYELPQPHQEDSMDKNQRHPTTRLVVNHRTRKVPGISQARVVDGNVQHWVELQNGDSRWF